MQEEMMAKKEEGRRYREFTVTPGINGFKVKIGCSEVYFGEIRELVCAIEKYLLEPHETERRFLSQDIRRNDCLATATEPQMPYQNGSNPDIPIEGYIRQR